MTLKLWAGESLQESHMRIYVNHRHRGDRRLRSPQAAANPSRRQMASSIAGGVSRFSVRADESVYQWPCLEGCSLRPVPSAAPEHPGSSHIFR